MPENIIGKKINSFIVIGEASGRFGKRKRLMWECECECGRRVNLVRFCIRKYKSCGCKRVEAQRKRCYKGYEELSLSYWSAVIKSAKVREIPFDLTMEEGWNLFMSQKRQCALSGVEIKFSPRSYGRQGTASLDRIDSSKGYTIDNIQWVHKDVNYMKTDMTEKEFLTWCKKIVVFNKSKQLNNKTICLNS